MDISMCAFMFMVSAELADCQALTTDAANEPLTQTEMVATKNRELSKQTTKIITALEQSDFLALTNEIHPAYGVRFSMYGHVQRSDKVFSRQQFTQHVRDEPNIRFTWGAQDGTGNPYVTSLPNYLQNWVAAGDLSKATTSINNITSHGNMLINIKAVYPDADVVQLHVAGSEQYGGMDWHDVFLVLQPYLGQHYLVAIVNDRWTT